MPIIRRLHQPILLLLLTGLWLPVSAEEFRLCTGNPDKTYYAVGTTLADRMPKLSRQGLRLTVVATEGSADNLQRLQRGECQGAISQGDVMATINAETPLRPITALYKELSLLICHRDSDIDEIGDLLDLSNPVVAVGSQGSGSRATWYNFADMEPAYLGVELLPINGLDGAMAVINGQANCVFEVIAPRSDFMTRLNDNATLSESLRFAALPDSFESYSVAGQQVYSRVEFDDESYPALSSWGDPSLLAINAYLVVTEAWAGAHPALLLDLSQALLTSHEEIETVAYGADRPFSE